jgi:hypothetical protein
MRSSISLLWLLVALSGSPPTRAHEMLHPDFPIVDGHYQMTKEWSVVLPEKFNRRFEEGSLVIWHPGFTIWTAVWGNDRNESKEMRVQQLVSRISSQAYDVEKSEHGGSLMLSYRLREGAEDKRVPAFYGFAFGERGHVQMAIYFNQEADLSKAKAILWSLHEAAP